MYIHRHFIESTPFLIFIPNRTCLVRFGGISGEFGRAMVRILARRNLAKKPMARPNEPDMLQKLSKKVRLGIYRTQIQNLAKNLGTPTLLFQSECFGTSANTAQLASAHKLSFGGKVFTSFTTGKH